MCVSSVTIVSLTWMLPLKPRCFLTPFLLQFPRPVQCHATSMFSHCPLLNFAATSYVNFCLMPWLILFPYPFIFLGLKSLAFLSAHASPVHPSRCRQGNLPSRKPPAVPPCPESQ